MKPIGKHNYLQFYVIFFLYALQKTFFIVGSKFNRLLGEAPMWKYITAQKHPEMPMG